MGKDKSKKKKAKSKKKKKKKKVLRPVVYDTWTERERGWGQRPDGYSLHLTKETYHKFIEDYWKKQKASSSAWGSPMEVPYEYSAPDGYTGTVEVNDETYKNLKRLNRKGVHGLRIYERTLDSFKK